MYSPLERVSSAVDSFSEVQATSHRNIYLATIAAQSFIMAMGLVSSFSSPALVDMARPGSRFGNLSSDQITWIASLPNLSGVLGNILSGYFSHKFGRKCVLMCISVPFTLSWLLIAYAPTVTFIYAGRLLSGFSSGMCTVAVPVYVVEISAVEIRGFLTAGFQVAFSVGVFAMTAAGIILRWSSLAILGALVVVIGACLMFFMPESPPWLIRNSRDEEAMRGIRFLKGQKYDAVKEFNETQQHLDQEPKSAFTLHDFLNPVLYKPVLIAFGLMFNQTFCGFPAIKSYTVQVLMEQNDFMNPNVSATVVVFVQMLSTILSSILVDRAGRKVLYVLSGSCMTLTLLVLGLFTYFSQNYDAIDLASFNWVPLFSLMIYISAFSLGFGPIPYVVIPELVPMHTRSFVMAAGCASASFFGFVVIKSFDVMRNFIGFYALYWLYGSFTFCGFLSYWIFVPETKGRCVREINQLFSNSPKI